MVTTRQAQQEQPIPGQTFPTDSPATMKNSIGLALAFAFAGIRVAHADATIDSTNHYAWAANIGFTDWRPSTTDGVSVGPNSCAGFTYAANVGWIKMGTGTPANGITYSNTSATDFGVNCLAGAAGEKNLRGFAYGANIGWLNFEATGNPRVILSTGRLRGFVWSANCGWINLDDANVFVQSAAQPPTPTPTPTATPAPTSTPGATPGPSSTPTPTPGSSSTPTPVASPTSTPNATPTSTPSPTPIPGSHLANISTRMRVEAGDNVLIAGFIVEGNTNKRLLIRGIGPSLGAFGIADALQDPTLQLFSANTQVGANDNWPDNANAVEIITTGLHPSNIKESALLVTVAPGTYTAVLRGANNGTGVGLIEVYDLDASGSAKVINISTRGFVLTGENVMIGGLTITGSDRSQLVVRAIGPSLGAFGIPDPLADPFLEIHDGNGATIETNNNWRENQEAAALQSSGLAPSNDLESAILISVAPGNYTAVVRGADGGIGNGLVEVYKLSP